MHEDSVVAICVPILFVFRRGAARRRLFDVVTMWIRFDFLLEVILLEVILREFYLPSFFGAGL